MNVDIRMLLLVLIHQDCGNNVSYTVRFIECAAV